jgi:hypothetical protein
MIPYGVDLTNLQTRLVTQDDQVCFLNDHTGDVSMIEATVIAMQNNIPTLHISGTNITI